MRLNFEKFAAHKELLAVCTSLDDTVCQNVIVDIQKLILDTYLFWVQVQRAFNFLLPVLRNLKEIHQTFQIFPELFRQLEEWCMKASFVEKQRVSVLTWWKGHSWVLQLSRIAIRSLSVPQTASPCERNWKAFRSIRRKNGIDEQKLVSLLQNLLLLENQAQVVQKKCDWVPLLTATLWWKSMWGKSCRIWFFFSLKWNTGKHWEAKAKLSQLGQLSQCVVSADSVPPSLLAGIGLGPTSTLPASAAHLLTPLAWVHGWGEGAAPGSTE